MWLSLGLILSGPYVYHQYNEQMCELIDQIKGNEQSEQMRQKNNFYLISCAR